MWRSYSERYRAFIFLSLVCSELDREVGVGLLRLVEVCCVFRGWEIPLAVPVWRYFFFFCFVMFVQFAKGVSYLRCSCFSYARV